MFQFFFHPISQWDLLSWRSLAHRANGQIVQRFENFCWYEIERITTGDNGFVSWIYGQIWQSTVKRSNSAICQCKSIQTNLQVCEWILAYPINYYFKGLFWATWSWVCWLDSRRLERIAIISRKSQRSRLPPMGIRFKCFLETIGTSNDRWCCCKYIKRIDQKNR